MKIWRDINLGSDGIFREARLVGSNQESMGDTVFERIVLFLMPYGEIETNGISKGLDPFRYHVVKRAAKFLARVVGFDLEPADDKAAEPVQFPGPLQMPEHPVDTIKIFAGVFDEKDLAGRIDITAGSCQGLDRLQVAANQLAFGRTRSVLRVRRGRVLHLFVAAERLAKGEDRGDLDRFRFCPIIRKAIAHLGVDRGDMQIGMDVAKQNGDVAEANDPFGIFQ